MDVATPSDVRVPPEVVIGYRLCPKFRRSIEERDMRALPTALMAIFVAGCATAPVGERAAQPTTQSGTWPSGPLPMPAGL